jgi:hypothetical protein
MWRPQCASLCMSIYQGFRYSERGKDGQDECLALFVINAVISDYRMSGRCQTLPSALDQNLEIRSVIWLFAQRIASIRAMPSFERNIGSYTGHSSVVLGFLSLIYLSFNSPHQVRHHGPSYLHSRNSIVDLE